MKKSNAKHCDTEAVLFGVEQVHGIACHTGQRNCFYRKVKDGELVDA